MRYLAILCAIGAAKMMTQNAIGHVGAHAFIQSENVKPEVPRFNKDTAPETNSVMIPVSKNWNTLISYRAGIMINSTPMSCHHTLAQRFAEAQRAIYYNLTVCAYA